MTATDPIHRALAALLLRHPFLAALALRLRRRADPSAKTAWTDGTDLAVNPEWFASLTPELRAFCLGHECYHVALAHHLRRGTREPGRWNRACDYAVNALLHADGFAVPDWALFDPTYGDAAAETIYDLLPPDPPATASGDSASGSAHSFPSPQPSGDGLGEVRDQPLADAASPPPLAERLAQHAVQIAALAQQTLAMGRDSAGVRRAAAAASQPPSIDWRALLADFLTSHQATDYTWQRPHPRYAHLGVYLPQLAAPALAPVAFVLDTSGSVPATAIEAVTAELDAYLRHHPTATLDLLHADAQVHARTTYTAADLPLRLHPVGGGGTDFCPAIEFLSQSDIPPACIVYLTDLCGRFPDTPPPTPVLWLVFGPTRHTHTAPFGRTVPLPY
jgi:predicted metal-dependent peptidase